MEILIVTNRVKRYVNGYKVIIEPLIEMGQKVYWAADFNDFKENLDVIPCEVVQVDFRSNPFDRHNLTAFHQLNQFLKHHHIDAIHCDTPIGGCLGRICGRKAKVNHIIYTAHGFHFYNGASYLHNLFYRTYEKMLAHWTDTLVTINEEDYNAAKSFHLKKGGKLFIIHGAGIDTDYVSKVTKEDKRKELNIQADDFVLCSAGDLNDNKNNRVIIEALAALNNKRIKYYVCGEGVLSDKLKALAVELKVEKQVIFLGFRLDILEILNASDVFVMPSFREGLPRSLMEAMVLRKPAIVSKIRGNMDLIKEGKGGYLITPNSVEEMKNAIEKMEGNPDQCSDMGNLNYENVQAFDVKRVYEEEVAIYKDRLFKGKQL